jgi:two-component system OmpR family sensor kinase
MSERILFRSLYSRIAVGFIALLAALLLAQTLLFLWLTDRFSRHAVNRSPAQLASSAALDLSSQLASHPDLQLEPYLRQHYGRVYQPFAVVLRDGRSGSNRPSALPLGLIHEARIRVERGEQRIEPRPRARPARAEYAPIEVNGAEMGVVAVPSVPPPVFIGLWELAPTLTWAGVALLALGAVTAALVIFGPTHKRLRTLDEAARALGEGRTDVRASETGGDEVTALARTFNRMAGDLQSRAVALAASDRARRQLLADVSHELMTPLSAIRGYVETLSMPELPLDDATRRRYLDIVHQETHKLEAIIGDLLDLARLEGGGETLRQAPVSVSELFARIADRHAPIIAERHITLTTDLADRALAVIGDASRLEQALQNVAANAIRHTPEGGQIVVRGESVGDRVKITVSDSGPGIRPEHLPHIFDRFYKADASRAGTTIPSGSGLGLSIVQAIVERHRGEIHASNAPEGGAKFELVLPAAAA